MVESSAVGLDHNAFRDLVAGAIAGTTPIQRSTGDWPPWLLGQRVERIGSE